MRILIVFLILVSLPAWSKDKTLKKIEIIKYDRKPSQVIPLDSQSERILKASALASEVVEYDSDQKEFHRKAYAAYQKISSLITFKNNEDPMAYVYDCLFMIEEGFYLKYSAMPKDKLAMTRKIVLESFDQ